VNDVTNMGIPGLESFLAKETDVYTRVRLKDLAGDGGRPALLVVSLEDMLYFLYGQAFGLDALQGGQIKEFSIRLADLAQRLRDIGLKLHFVSHGGRSTREEHAWFDAQKQKALEYHKDVFQLLERSREPGHGQLRPWCPLGKIVAERVFKSATGCQVTSVDGNVDEELVKIAVKVIYRSNFLAPYCR